MTALRQRRLAVPALVISTRDDPLAPYRFAARAASRILGARLVTIEQRAGPSVASRPLFPDPVEIPTAKTTYRLYRREIGERQQPAAGLSR